MRKIFLIATIVAMTSASAQTRDQMIRSRVDSVLAERYYHTPYDTNYVVRPEGRLTLKVRMNQTGNSFHAKGTVDDTYCKADLSTSHKTTFSIAVLIERTGEYVQPVNDSGGGEIQFLGQCNCCHSSFF